MTQALSAAVASAAKLPEEEQNALAAILLEEMESEERWNTLFAGSQNLLEQMAYEAIQKDQARLPTLARESGPSLPEIQEGPHNTSDLLGPRRS